MNIKKATLATIALLTTACSNPESQADDSAKVVASQAECIGKSLSGPLFSAKRAAYIGASGNQYYEFGSTYDPGDPTHLLIHNGPVYSTPNFPAEPSVSESFEFSSSFEMVAVHAKSKDHYYIAGRDGQQDVIERWKRGNAAAVSGGPLYVMKRTSLFRGSLGGIKSIAVDHLARFLLVVHGNAPTLVSKIPLPAGGAPTLLYSSSQISQLDMAADSFFPRKHANHGIVWSIGDSAPSQYFVWLIDAQDDGVIDEWRALTANEVYTNEPTSSVLWEDWFMSD